MRSRRPLKIRRRLVIFAPGRTHIRSRSPRLTASSRCNNVGKGSRQIGSVTSGQGLALRAGPVGLEYEAGLGRARAGRGPLSASVVRPGARSARVSRRASPVRPGGVAATSSRVVAASVGGLPIGLGDPGSSSDRCSDLPVDCLSYAAATRLVRPRRLAFNSRLRTGTDQGNPTV